jgi:hypothetical protein
MAAGPILTLAGDRDPRAEAVVTGGLAEFNKAVFGRVDSQRSTFSSATPTPARSSEVCSVTAR